MEDKKTSNLCPSPHSLTFIPSFLFPQWNKYSGTSNSENRKMQKVLFKQKGQLYHFLEQPLYFCELAGLIYNAVGFTHPPVKQENRIVWKNISFVDRIYSWDGDPPLLSSPSFGPIGEDETRRPLKTTAERARAHIRFALGCNFSLFSRRQVCVGKGPPTIQPNLRPGGQKIPPPPNPTCDGRGSNSSSSSPSTHLLLSIGPLP